MGIYLDHNAASPLRPAVRAAITHFLSEEGGNPASIHQPGQAARRALEHARAQVAGLIDADARQVIFTSGGTESNNLAIIGAMRAPGARRKIVSSAIEHSSVLAPLNELEAQGFNIVRVAPDHEGRLAPNALASAIDSETALVTLALANSEVGTIQEVATIAAAASAAGAIFHLDAAQAVGRIPVDVARLRCDMMTMSGHKLGAPAGIGALYVRDPAALAPLILGGPQESGMRAGTPNLLGAIAFGVAAQAVVANFHQETMRIAVLSNELLATLFEEIPGLRLNAPIRDRIVNTLNLTFPGVLGESLLIALDLEGIHVSMGSACAAGAVEPSHVLLAMGRSAEEARSSLRLSLGWSTSADDVARAGEVIPRVWRRVFAAEPAPASAGAAR